MRVAILGLVVFLAAPAAAKPREGHLGQVELSLSSAIGYRAIVPYDKGTYCGQLDASTSSGNAPVCTSRAPFSLDIELGYGVDKKADVFVETRIGLEHDFGATSGSGEGPRMFFVSPGVRVFFSDSKTFKLFTTAQLVIDFSGYKDPAGEGRGPDFGARNKNGLWFDLGRNYAVYAYVGPTLTFARWLRFELEGGVGLQVRYP